MDLDEGTVQGHGFDLHADDLSLLQLCKDAIQHPALRPTIHASINGVPVAEPLGQTAPFAPLLGDVQDAWQVASCLQWSSDEYDGSLSSLSGPTLFRLRREPGTP